MKDAATRKFAVKWNCETNVNYADSAYIDYRQSLPISVEDRR